jgi:maltooligosyltrehalose trehalohydrolase
MDNVSSISVSRRLPIGAELSPAGGVDFRVWAPCRKQVDVVLEGRAFPLSRTPDGYFSGFVEEARAGSLYRYRIEGGDAFPDPASRFQPEGPHGPSQVVDPGQFAWTDHGWQGVSLAGQIIYEMHIGTFTPERTWASAAQRLPDLVELGVTVLEIMPVADFTGNFGWGYDGVNMFAPTRLYGTPDDFRSFVDKAHSLGLAVILDVVYNHFGADGNYLAQFCNGYISETYTTDWGDAINFDGDDSGPVREFFISNAGYWIDEFHLDGLRLDATQNIYDRSNPHVLAEITDRVRAAARGRQTIVVAENEPQHVKLARSRDEGGYGMDGLWNDDYHHTALVALTGRNEAYFTDYRGQPQEFISAMKYGYLYQGQQYTWQSKRRGTPSFGVPPSAFITFLENHDQVANLAWGLRVHRLSAPGMYRVFTALTMLGPGTPMLFQGQEYASSKPFHYFADVPDYLREGVRRGRREFMNQFASMAGLDGDRVFVDPCSPATLEEATLDWSEVEKHAAAYRFHRDLLQLRREDPVLRIWNAGKFDGAVLSDHSMCLRVFGEEHGDRLLVFNFGLMQRIIPAPEPLLAPPYDSEWELVFSTENPLYGGRGTPPLKSEENWRLPGHFAAVFTSVAGEPREEEFPLKNARKKDE